ncbi:DUF1289 domain-containing protein [Litoribrevibacter albus]|uniref:DUF1289 domain-containing protein n=1 Tax=Litoribrevibacter albus TaxID=1473156 RepID=A0AA37S7V0_9GAMM|nr:DUF1289 domain-containing protein [Litoribrevibacter albus]GLQ30840.1 hypothetical protein GCM10007876_13190 [Litoribrevibacter albus]
MADFQQGSEIRSPCVRNCCLDMNDVCLGCFRTYEEILEWSHATDERREAILNLAQTRKDQHQNRKLARSCSIS